MQEKHMIDKTGKLVTLWPEDSPVHEAVKRETESYKAQLAFCTSAMALKDALLLAQDIRITEIEHSNRVLSGVRDETAERFRTMREELFALRSERDQLQRDLHVALWGESETTTPSRAITEMFEDSAGMLTEIARTPLEFSDDSALNFLSITEDL